MEPKAQPRFTLVAMGSRRGSGEGSVYKEVRTRSTKDGPKTTTLWRASVEIDTLDGRRRRIKVSARTKVLALDKLKKAQREAESGLTVDRTITLGAYLEGWLTTVVANRVDSSNTVANYRFVVDKHLTPALGKVRLSQLTPEHVDRLLRSKADAGLSRSYVGRMRTVLTDALKHAEARGLVDRNAGRLSTMPKITAPAERAALTPEEGRRLLKAADGDRLGAMIATGLMLGLRPGEMTGLLWSDLDLDGTPPTLAITGSVKRRPDSSLYRGAVKKATAGERTIELPASLLARLRAHRKAQAAERLTAGELWHDNGLVFCTPTGTFMDPSNVRKRFAAIGARAGLKGGFPYLLRHATVSQLLDRGQSIEQVADLVGDDPRTLYRHYRHKVRPVVDVAASEMDDMYGQSSVPNRASPQPER